MTSAKPLILSIAALIIFGLLVPQAVSWLAPSYEIPTNSLTTAVASLITTDLTLDVLLFEINLNPFSWLGSSFQTYLGNMATYLAIYPLWFTISILLLVLVSLIYTMVSLVRGN